jgi:CYTH domain-containing protein
MLRLSRKADADVTTRLISSIYLSEEDFAALRKGLDGVCLSKTRHRLDAPPGILMCIDEFDGALSGLLIAEAEFPDDEALSRFAMPAFAVREITADVSFSGYSLAAEGLPREL